MSKITIKKLAQDNKTQYLVPAIILNKKDGNILIPSPFGTELIFFDSLEEAEKAIHYAGYQYNIENVSSPKYVKEEKNIPQKEINHDKIIEVFIKNLGHENLEIRTTAINSLIKYGTKISEELIGILKTETNWLIIQSAIKCIEGIISNDQSCTSIFVDDLIIASSSENTYVRISALKALEKISM